MAVTNVKSSQLHSGRVSGPRGWGAPLVVLIVLLLLVFLTGGTSRYDTPHLIILRPAAILAAGVALLTLEGQHLRAYRPLFLILMAAVLLTGLHLVPLPPKVWQSLPGRDLIVQIDELAGFEDLWRPLSMFPEGTWNALFALAVPVAVVFLAVQLDERDQARLLTAVVLLCAASGLVGVGQAAGIDLRFYRVSSETPGLFANRNHQAAALAAMFPMLMALVLISPAYTRNAGSLRIVIIAGMVALLPIIIVTGSRMGVIVGAISLACLVFMLFHPESASKIGASKRVLLVVSGAVIAAAMVGGTIYLSRDVALGRISGGVEDELRLPMWQQMIDFAPNYLPWGSGVGSYVPVNQIHESSALLMPAYFNQAHNDWLDVMLTSGLPGVALAIAVILMFALSAKGAMITRGVSGHLRRCGVIVALVLAFASLTDYPLRTPILSALMAIAAVWASGPVSREIHKES